MRDAPHCDRCGEAIDWQARDSVVTWRRGLAERTYVHVRCLTPGDAEAVLEALR
jgi:hypothetical protein